MINYKELTESIDFYCDIAHQDNFDAKLLLFELLTAKRVLTKDLKNAISYVSKFCSTYKGNLQYSALKVVHKKKYDFSKIDEITECEKHLKDLKKKYKIAYKLKKQNLTIMTDEHLTVHCPDVEKIVKFKLKKQKHHESK